MWVRPWARKDWAFRHLLRYESNLHQKGLLIHSRMSQPVDARLGDHETTKLWKSINNDSLSTIIGCEQFGQNFHKMCTKHLSQCATMHATYSNLLSLSQIHSYSCSNHLEFVKYIYSHIYRLRRNQETTLSPVPPVLRIPRSQCLQSVALC